MSDMSEMKHLNLTAIARETHSTTPVAREKLKKKGVEPISEIKMPSGRIYTLYDGKVARKAIAEINKERLGYDPKVLENLERAKQPVKDPEVKQLAAEVREMKDLIKQMLELSTRPAGR